MYKGKFDQKNRESGADLQEILAQRSQDNAARAARAAARKSAPPKKAAAPVGKPPVQKPAAPRPAAPVPTPPTAPAKKPPRVGSLVFYTLYCSFILVFFVATFIGLNWLNGWLADFEASQPTTKAQMVFDRYFADPDWANLFQLAGASPTDYEDKDVYAAYMNEKMAGRKLSYLETSAGLSGDKKYVVRLGDEKVATFTLTDKKAQNASSEDITSIPDWQPAGVEVFFQRDGFCRIETMAGHRVLVNGVELSDNHVIQIAGTKAEEYLPEGTPAVRMYTYEVKGLLMTPEVKVLDAMGKETEVTYDEETKTFTQRTTSNTITPEQEQVVQTAAQTFCMWMIKEVTSRDTVAKYFEKGTETYNTLVKTTELWVQAHKGYNFSDIKITDFNLYGTNIFSARISMNLNVTRTDDTVRQFPYAQSMFFEKKDGRWLCTQAINVDISQPLGKVRLTFMDGSRQVLTGFYETDAETIIPPSLTAPEGKVFVGWLCSDLEEPLLFKPDENGHVVIPDGMDLLPMTLYALYEEAGSNAASPVG